eukprot:2310937-Pyramimonas_sp.AAC.1
MQKFLVCRALGVLVSDDSSAAHIVGNTAFHGIPCRPTSRGCAKEFSLFVLTGPHPRGSPLACLAGLFYVFCIIDLFLLLSSGESLPVFGKDVVWARSSLRACLTTADHHFAVWQHLGELVEPN